ncbi:PLAT/LH2 domain-containing protein [Brevibacillus laterosporus]|uniref:PLAT/LH2 domain-containing protein n=1 Tax=Brevibacillus laterosporus TaxID=1465 RepID=UPI0035A6F466
MKRFALSSIMAVALLFAGQSVYASDIPQNSNSNHKVSVNPQIDVAASYNYGVTIKTADVKDAGTNSNIYILLHGSNGNSPRVHLDKPGYDDFEPGDVDTYYISASRNLGEINAISIYSDGAGYKSGWFPTSFTVKYDSREWTFHNEDWIGENGAQTVTLYR